MLQIITPLKSHMLEFFFFVAKKVPSEGKNIEVAAPSGKPRPSAVMEWTAEHVNGWLHEKDLGDCTEAFPSFEGTHLNVLHSSYQDDHREFKKEMRSDYNICGPKYVKFQVALVDLFKTVD